MFPHEIAAYRESLAICAKRYKKMAAEDEELNGGGLMPRPSLVPFSLEFEQGVEDCLPLMKLNRWVGYIQGVLIERGITTVEEERNFTRPLFRPIDFPFD